MSTHSILASPALGANVVPGLILVSDDQLDALDAPLGNEVCDSTVDVQSVELSHYCYEGVWLSAGPSLDTTLSLRDIESSHVKILAFWIRSLAIDYCNGMITVTWSAQCHMTDSPLQDAVAKDGDEKVVKEGIKMILLDWCHCCSAASQLKV